VKYAEDRELWYADVTTKTDIDLHHRPRRFLRLALVAFQPTEATSTSLDLPSSPVVVTDPVQLSGALLVSTNAPGGQLGVNILVMGAYNKKKDAEEAETWLSLVVSAQYPWHYEPIRNGRIVVEEIRTGWSQAAPGGTEERVMFTETFEFQELL
jgi:hypothetical protein